MERKHETKLPVIIDTETGVRESVIDLATIPLDELLELIPQVPLAMIEYQFRTLIMPLSETPDTKIQR